MSGRDLLVDVEGTPIAGGGCGAAAARRGQGGRRAAPPVALRQLRGARAAQPAGGGQGPDRARQPRAAKPVAASTTARAPWSRWTRRSASWSGWSSSRGPRPAAWRPARSHSTCAPRWTPAIERLRARGSDREVRVTASGDPEVIGDRPLTRAGDHEPADERRSLLGSRTVRSRSRSTTATRRCCACAMPGRASPTTWPRCSSMSGSAPGVGWAWASSWSTPQCRRRVARVQLEERRPRASFVLRWPRGAAAGDWQRVEPEADQPRDAREPRPTDLLRLRDAVEPYPPNRRTRQLAEELGLPLEQLVRFDMNTLGGGPLAGGGRGAGRLRPRPPGRVRRPGVPPPAGRDPRRDRRAGASDHPRSRRRMS